MKRVHVQFCMKAVGLNLVKELSLTADLRWTVLTAALRTCHRPQTPAGEGNTY